MILCRREIGSEGVSVGACVEVDDDDYTISDIVLEKVKNIIVRVRNYVRERYGKERLGELIAGLRRIVVEYFSGNVDSIDNVVGLVVNVDGTLLFIGRVDLAFLALLSC